MKLSAVVSTEEAGSALSLYHWFRDLTYWNVNAGSEVVDEVEDRDTEVKKLIPNTWNRELPTVPDGRVTEIRDFPALRGVWK